jgi:two-component system, NtrC family, sensor kinase
MAEADPFKALIDEAPDGIVILDRGCVAYINATAARLLGTQQDQAIGAPIASFLPAADAARAGERIGRLISTGDEVMPADYRTLADPERIVEIKAKRWQWNGRPAVLAFARDVSERRVLEQQLIRADRLAAIGTLAASVAHEINNPLTYLQLSIQLVENALEKLPGTPPQVGDLLRDANTGVERVAAITRGLRTFARPHDTATGPLDFVAVVDSALRMVDNDLRHRARLVRRVEEVPWVIGNATRLEQVLVNVLVNAIQSLRGRGDDTITVEVASRSSTEVAVSVRDTGAGMSKETRERMFDPFFTTKQSGESMGLGLAVTRSILDSIGGRIEVESAEYDGTTVTIILRAHERRASSPVLRAPTPVPYGLTRHSVLIVDDEDLVRTLLADVLRAQHDVAEVHSASAAVEHLATHEVDAIVCDVMMPGRTGVDLHEHLLASHPAVANKFVFMTGGTFTPELESYLVQSGRPLLAKPFAVDALLSAIDVAAGGGTV